MNPTLKPEAIRLIKEITPKKRKTFSENMQKLRKPFLHSESDMDVSLPSMLFKSYKSSWTENCSKDSTQNLSISSEEIPNANSSNPETKIEEPKDDIEMSGCSEVSQISGYYSENSSWDNKGLTKNLIGHKELRPLTNSTFIDQKETTEIETSNGLNATKYGSELSISESLPQTGSIDGIKTNINLLIPQNEFDINQIEVKGKVMGQLLEASKCGEFPKLKRSFEKDNKKVSNKDTNNTVNKVNGSRSYVRRRCAIM